RTPGGSPPRAARLTPYEPTGSPPGAGWLSSASTVAQIAASKQAMPLGAANVLARPGFLLGDTSLVVYFDAEVSAGDPTSWARWWARVADAETGRDGWPRWRTRGATSPFATPTTRPADG
ncbi:MAG: hypothetical protein KJO75_17420, partial [Dactylosporangium sp.]|nr:hypothetical protein [Dactylosporangium sp.]